MVFSSVLSQMRLSRNSQWWEKMFCHVRLRWRKIHNYAEHFAMSSAQWLAQWIRFIEISGIRMCSMSIFALVLIYTVIFIQKCCVTSIQLWQTFSVRKNKTIWMITIQISTCSKPYLELTRVRFPRKALFANSGCEELVRPW